MQFPKCCIWCPLWSKTWRTGGARCLWTHARDKGQEHRVHGRTRHWSFQSLVQSSKEPKVHVWGRKRELRQIKPRIIFAGRWKCQLPHCRADLKTFNCKDSSSVSVWHFYWIFEQVKTFSHKPTANIYTWRQVAGIFATLTLISSTSNTTWHNMAWISVFTRVAPFSCFCSMSPSQTAESSGLMTSFLLPHARLNPRPCDEAKAGRAIWELDCSLLKKSIQKQILSIAVPAVLSNVKRRRAWCGLKLTLVCFLLGYLFHGSCQCCCSPSTHVCLYMFVCWPWSPSRLTKPKMLRLLACLLPEGSNQIVKRLRRISWFTLKSPKRWLDQANRALFPVVTAWKW